MDSLPHRRLNAIRQVLLPIAALAVVLSCVSTREELGPLGEWAETEQATLATGWAQLDMTSTALASLEAELHNAQTLEAAEAVAPQIEAPAPAPQIDAPAAPAPPAAQVGHVPGILNIDIARQVPADGTKVGGTIIFEDAAQDVVLLRAEVLAATLRAESWTYDPRQNMAWSGTRGIAAFQVWCTGDPQDVSYNFTLEDSAGNVSPAWRVDYTCQ